MQFNLKLTIKKWLIPFAVFLSCVTPRFSTFMKVNLGIHASFYALSVVLIWIFTHKKRNNFMHIQPLFFYIWLFAAVISIWQNTNINRWLLYVYYIFICILLMQIFLSCDDSDVYNRVTFAVSLGVMIQVAIGYFEVTTHTYLFNVGSFASYHYGKEAVSMFYNPNDYSAFITTLLPFVIYRFLASEGLIKKIVYGILIFATVDLIIITLARSAILALVFAGIFIFILFVKKDRLKIKAFFIVLAGIIAVLFIPAVQMWIQAIIINNTIDTSSVTDSSRINLIKNGLYFLRETFGMGVGAGNLETWFAEKSIYPIGKLLYMHNWYVEILVTFGIIIFLLYIVTHITIFWESYKVAENEKKLYGIHTAYLLSFAIFTVTSVASSSNVYSEWVWMYLALMVSYMEKYRTSATLRFKIH